MPSRRSHASDEPIIGIGVYSAPRAARLIGVKPDEVRRWLRGYRHHPALWKPQLPSQGDELRLGFLDLMELRSANSAGTA